MSHVHTNLETLAEAAPGEFVSFHLLMDDGEWFYRLRLEATLERQGLVAVPGRTVVDDWTIHRAIVCDGCGETTPDIHAHDLDGERYCPTCAGGLVRLAQECLGRFTDTIPAPSPREVA